MKIGIVAVHGVQPHPRYDMQDQCATSLVTALNANEEWKAYGSAQSQAFADASKSTDPQPPEPWVFSVVGPLDASVAADLTPRPTISRVRINGDDPDRPAETYFDVIEAYWSPLDKGKSTFLGIASWLMQTIFVPLNTTARYTAGTGKTLYDVGLVLTGIIFVVVLLAAALAATVASEVALTHKSINDAIGQILSPGQSILAAFSPPVLGVLVLGVAGGFLLVQGIKAVIGIGAQWKAHKQIPAQKFDRLRLVACVFAAGILLLIPAFVTLRWVGVAFILAGLFFEIARTTAQSFFINFFADVQIYATRDENESANAMRGAILDLVTETIAHASSDKANGGWGYDKVFVLAHSLGSTISLDALIRYHQLVQQCPVDSPERAYLQKCFQRIRAFVTFGSPLEKTKYFTDVNHPSPSLSYDQWRSDAFGPLFTTDLSQVDLPNDKATGMFWGNFWYFADAISNELDSYRSFVPAGGNAAQGHHLRRVLGASRQNAIGRNLVWNEKGSKGIAFPSIIPHGEYLGDPWFWNTKSDPTGTDDHLGVLDVVARTASSPDRTAFVRQTCSIAANGATYVTVSPQEARKYRKIVD